MNRISSPESIDPTIHAHSIPILNFELEPIIDERVKSEIKNLERQVKEIKEAQVGGVRLSYICLYPDLEYPPKFRVPVFKNMKGMVVHGHTSTCRNCNVQTRQK